MKYVAVILILFVTAACNGPEIPQAYSPNSPAAPNAMVAPRFSVASVLTASNPIDAEVCIAAQPCALDETPKDGQVENEDRGMDHSGHAGHGSHNHANTPASRQGDHRGHKQ